MDKIYKYEELNSAFPFKIKYAEMKPLYDMGRVYHWHNYLEISYVKKGKGIYHIEDRSYPVETGDIIVINNIESHYMEVSAPSCMVQPVLMIDPGLLYSGLTGTFEHNYLAPFFNRSERFNNRISSDEPYGKRIYRLLEEIVYEYSSKNRGYELMIKAKLLNVVTLLFRHYASSLEVSEETVKRARQLKRIEDSLEYINKNSSGNISLDMLSKLSYMNRSYFSLFFKSTTGLPPFEYINTVRISNALRLIKTTDMKISDVAQSCGFNNLSHFNRVFKKLTGSTPKETRYSNQI